MSASSRGKKKFEIIGGFGIRRRRRRSRMSRIKVKSALFTFNYAAAKERGGGTNRFKSIKCKSLQHNNVRGSLWLVALLMSFPCFASLFGSVL
jgi:hypothetical protein